ncbi:MAG: tripartite tricarboxylate transporter substrate binding protein [Burkholderiales bacterium]|nr:tripartite tricarboxylate transporter substrate binding protein [Burkholderiales bacterium]
MYQRIRCLMAACVVLTPITGVAQQNYPDKPIRLVVPYAPGGNTDILARTVAQRITDNWGKQVVVDNRGSANGIAAAEISARSTPDGHTVFVGSTREMSVNPHLFGNMPYNVERDFLPVSQGTITPILLAVHPSLSAQNVKELVEYAKKQPGGSIPFGSPGIGTPMHLSGELLNMMTGLKMIHVAYKGGGPVTTAVISGQEIKFGYLGMGPAIPHVKSGRIRPLALTITKRAALLPDVPTMIEQGYKDFNTNIWFAFFLPAGTPQAIVRKLNGEINRVLHMKEVVDFLVSTGVEIDPGTPEALRQTVLADKAKYGQVIKAANIKAQ